MFINAWKDMNSDVSAAYLLEDYNRYLAMNYNITDKTKLSLLEKLVNSMAGRIP